MLNKDNDVVLVDFGVSTRFEGTNDIVKGTAGTIKYFAPELVKVYGKKPKIIHGMPTDVWAIGIVLY